MVLTGLLYFISVALILTLVFTYGLRIRGPWGNFWAFFLILFLAIWMADAWIMPVGPMLGEIFWVPPLVVGLLIALILAAATPKVNKDVHLEQQQPSGDDSRAIALGVVFWMLVMIMLSLAIIGLLI